MSEFTELVEHCKQLETLHSGAHAIMGNAEDVYLMRDTEEDTLMRAQGTTLALVKDPGDRNAIISARRLLTATEPLINVPFDENGTAAKEQSENIELAARAMVAQSDRYSRKPLHYDATLSALIYDAVHIQVISTADLVKNKVRNSGDIQKATPYIFKIINPRQGYPEFDDYGNLTGYLRIYEATGKQILEAYPDAKGMISDADKYKLFRVYDYWDLTSRWIWLQREEQPFYKDIHGLNFIPIIVTSAEGSGLFGDVADQVEPFLFTELQSGMYKRRNEILTGWLTQVRRLGLTPVRSWKPETEGAERPQIIRDGFEMYWNEGGGTFNTQFDRGLIDPAAKEALALITQLGEESTMSKTATGQYLGSAAAFSTHALLSQLARLPLETIRSQTGRAIADALEIAFRWWKAEGGGHTIYNANNGVMAKLTAADIPDNLTLKVDLDVALPQDMVSQANIVTQLEGKVPKRLLFEKMLKLGQWDAAQTELWDEQFTQAMYSVALQQMIQQGMQQQQQMIQPPQIPGGQPPPQGMPGGQGMPREMAMMGGQGPVDVEQGGGYVSDLP